MIEFIFNKASRILREHNELLVSPEEHNLLNKLAEDKTNYKPINFYHIDAGQQIIDKQNTIEYYLQALGQMLYRLEQIQSPSKENQPFLIDLASVIESLHNKKNKLIRLQAMIPNGIYDVKRALIVANQKPLSESPTEQSNLKSLLKDLNDFMSRSNNQYNRIIKQGGTVKSIVFNTTRHYWESLYAFNNLLKQIMLSIEACSSRTPTSYLVHSCLQIAQTQIPNEKHIQKTLKILHKKSHTAQLEAQTLKETLFFCSKRGVMASQFLERQNKRFFYMPHSEEMYHIDYDPRLDLAETGGNCFGESLMFIHALHSGCFKRMCPETGIFNFQLDQTRTLDYRKTTLGHAETEVSSVSNYHSIQWSDLKDLLTDNPNFQADDLCILLFSMNEYTRQHRKFTPAHIAVVAKLDPARSPYQYIIFEKSLGVFGLNDDESLEYIIKQIMRLYEGMNYSNCDLIKYEEATSLTYEALNKINPVSQLELSSNVNSLSICSATHARQANLNKQDRLNAPALT